MLTQLDLFGAPAEESKKPAPGRKRLSPPSVVELSQDSPDAVADSPQTTETRIAVTMPKAETATGPLPEQQQNQPIPAVITIAAKDASVETEDTTVAAKDTTATPETSQEEARVDASESIDELPRKSTRGRKSVKEMSREASLVELPADEQLYSKQYYGIGEVAAMFHVNASLLRFWEAEFDILKPRKNKKGDRFFRPEDIKNLQLIHHLLRERKYTIDGARDFLRKSGKRKEQFEAIESLKKIRAFLLELKAGL